MIYYDLFEKKKTVLLFNCYACVFNNDKLITTMHMYMNLIFVYIECCVFLRVHSLVYKCGWILWYKTQLNMMHRGKIPM